MFPLWDVAIAPVIRAAGARRVVEIGALKGENTKQILDVLGPDAELHVIDPVPDFDPAEHERRFAGRYVFHQDLSLNVLSGLAPMDAALIDGDHNWYTVYHELRALSDVARRAGEPLPVLVLHDVAWPYGRRDQYYAPETIPEQHQQPHRQAGIRPGRAKLVPSGGGLNPTMWNAEEEGGPRNGVMTALDDFIAEYDQPLRLVEIPIYFGLAIVVEVSRLEARPELAAVLDRLESAEGRFELMKVAEAVRLRAMLFQHNIFFQRDQRADRSTKRYLDVVKAALLDEHYLENEARFEHLWRRMNAGRPPDPDVLRDPKRQDRETFERLLRQRTGVAGPEDATPPSFVPYTAMGRRRLDHLERCLDVIRSEDIEGDLAECGTGRGGGAIYMRAYLEAHEVRGRAVWVADSFRAAPEPDRKPSLPKQGIAGFQADLNQVRDGFARFEMLDDRVHFLQGPFDATLADAPIERLALVRIGGGLGGQVRAVLDHLYGKLAVGGFVVVEGRNHPACAKEIDAFRDERGITDPVERVDDSVIVWRKGVRDRAGDAESRVLVDAPRAPLAPPAPTDVVDLTVVVVVYNMRREAERTLHALSRAYQEGIDDISYEVIVCENGSDEDQRLGAEFVARFGPEFRYLDMGDDARPSPVNALNAGIRRGRGRSYALMIDGAHVLTPGVLRFGLVGLETYAPAIVATQQWYVGPGQQGHAMDDGYDEGYEDRLFEAIKWPSAGYRLFEIGHFVGDRDWFDGVWESNCMFVSRAQLEQVGGFDESFAMSGGGYANLELYERLGASTDITVATIIGEGSFHQVHGGTTTNQPDPVERRARVYGYSEHFADLRGRAFRGPNKPLHYVGRINTLSARRTKPRRMSTAKFAEGAGALEADGPPRHPIPVPEELVDTFTEAVWRSIPWRRTSWLGRRIETAPTDLLAYHEIIDRVRPDWIVETGTGDGGRALFLASMCELVQHGEVLSIDESQAEDLPQHPRLRYLAGAPPGDQTIAAVTELIGTLGALVIIGSCADRLTTMTQFEGYAPLVPVGSYVVVTDTVVNGHPVWPAFGPGPAEAVKQILLRHGEFVADTDMTKYSLTFNPGGFLKRLR